MGFRTLVEINHDTIDRIDDSHVPDFMTALRNYARSADDQTSAGLARFDVHPVALRHSGDKYVISSLTWGFPARLPPEEAQKRARQLMATVRHQTALSGSTKDELKSMLVVMADLLEQFTEEN